MTMTCRMTGTARLRHEQQFHDRQACERAVAIRSGRAELFFTDDEFLDHESWVRPAFAELGDLRGKDALDYGAGHGMAAVVMARAGARVTAFDLSPRYVAEARLRARANGVEVACVVADGHRLPFPDHCFDVVWGNAVLHHLDLSCAAVELSRVLRPDGVAVFCEPWGENPLLDLARRCLPYPGKSRTPDEAPLTRSDLTPLTAAFGDVSFKGCQLLGMVRRLWPDHPLSRLCDAGDRYLLRRWPVLQRWCRYAVIVLRRPNPVARARVDQ